MLTFIGLMVLLGIIIGRLLTPRATFDSDEHEKYAAAYEEDMKLKRKLMFVVSLVVSVILYYTGITDWLRYPWSLILGFVLMLIVYVIAVYVISKIRR